MERCSSCDALAVMVAEKDKALSELMYHIHSEPRMDGNHVYQFRSRDTLARTMADVLPAMALTLPQAAKVAEARKGVCEALREWRDDTDADAEHWIKIRDRAYAALDELDGLEARQS